MIKDLLFPWQSHIMLENPMALPVFMVILSFLLSIITWISQRNSK
jgi:hypothetical protein